MADPLPRITRRPQPAQPVQPAEESIGDKVLNAGAAVGSAALSGLGMVGNLIDLIPSMARDVAVLDNPFDQFLDPLSHSSTGRSASGRDVLSRNVLTSWLFTPNKETGISGWKSDPLEGVQDVLGFGLEMASGGFVKAPGTIVRGIRGVPAPSAAATAARAAKTAQAANVSADVAGAAAGAAGVAAGAGAKATVASKLSRGLQKFGNVMNELDPGTHVGRFIDRTADATRRALVFGPERKRVASLLKGVSASDDEADAVLRIAEARAMTWAKEQPGRTPDEYFKGFEDIRRSEPGQVGADALQQGTGDSEAWNPVNARVQIPDILGKGTDEQYSLMKQLTRGSFTDEQVRQLAESDPSARQVVDAYFGHKELQKMAVDQQGDHAEAMFRKYPALQKRASGNETLNTVLRGATERTGFKGDWGGRDMEFLSALQDASATAPPTTADLVGTREIMSKHIGETLKGMQVGEITDVRAPTAVSLNANYSGNHAGNADFTHVTFEIPKGTRGFWFNGAAKSLIKEEHEFLLPVGTKYQLLDKTIDQATGYTSARVRIVDQADVGQIDFAGLKAGDTFAGRTVLEVKEVPRAKTFEEGNALMEKFPEGKIEVLGDGKRVKVVAFSEMNQRSRPALFQEGRGAIEFLDDNRAVIHAFQSADVSTLAHELGHKFRRDIPSRLLGEAADAIGGIDDINNWPRKAEEAFASGFERYLRDGSAPTATLTRVFEKFKEWMTNIYQSIIGTPLEESVNPQLRAVFDQMLGGQPAAGISPSSSPFDAMFQPAWHVTANEWAPEPGFPNGRLRIDKVGTGTGKANFGHGVYLSGSSEFGDAAFKQMSESGNANIFKMDIPDDDVARMLDYDKSLGEQSSILDALKSLVDREKAFVDQFMNSDSAARTAMFKKATAQQKAAIAVHRIDSPPRGPAGKLPFATGNDIRVALAEMVGPKGASEILRSAGIPGAKYVDEAQQIGAGSQNFLVWDQDVLDRVSLLEKNQKKLQQIAGPAGNAPQGVIAPARPQTPPAAATGNQIDDPILKLSGETAPIAPASTVRGKLDRAGDFLSEMDPGTHVGRVVEKTIGNLSEKLSLPQIFEQQVTQRFLKTRFGKVWSERAASRQRQPMTTAAKRGPADASGGKYFADMTAQQELQYLMGSGSVARGSRILSDLTPDQDLATRLGSAFGGEVLFFGGSPAASKANGVRVHDTGSRVWVSADAAPSAYNNIVGHELVHLLRDVSTDAFNEVVRVIQAHAPSDELAKQTAQYMADYRAAFGRELRAGVRQEEGVARTVQAAFDRPAFWEDLVSNPSVAEPVRKAFSQTMEKLKSSGKLTIQEYEVVDRELSAFIFGQADAMAAGATADTLDAAQKARSQYSSSQIDPLADMLATPGTKTHRLINTVEDLASRINAGIQAAMNYKVGGHTYPVVQAFSRAKTNLYESMVSDVSLPAMSAVETVHRLVDALPPEADSIAALSKYEEDIVRAIEKGDYSSLAPELHPAVRQMELAQKALFERELRAGVKVEKLSDTYVQYFAHALHPEIREKLAEIDAASSLRSPADLAATHKATQSRRTDLFREAWHGRATWNAATSDPQVLEKLKDATLGGNPNVRTAAAADVLRTKYLSEIDPRIPVERDGSYTLIQRKNPSNYLSAMDQPVELTVSPDQLKRMNRVDSPHDLTTEAGRIAEHTNEPIIYALERMDADGNQVITEYELLTARLPGDTRYGDPLAKLPDGSPDRTSMGFYRTATEGKDRHQVLADWMAKIGTDTLEKTAGVFSGSALRNWQESMRSKTNTLAVAETFPQLIFGAIKAGKLASAQGDPVKVGRSLTLKSLFDSPYYNSLDRKIVYLKAATLDPGLQQIARNANANKFVQIMDDMVLDKTIMDDLKLAGTYTQKLPAIENILKPMQSAGSMWKAGVLTHPGRYVRDMISGLAQLVYGGRFSNSAADAARRATFNEPVEELLQYSAVKNYLDRFEMEHTPENATRAVRTMFGNFMQQSGGSIYRDYTDATRPMESAARGIESMSEAFPGDGRTGILDMIRGAGRTAIGREGDTTFNLFDIAGVQHVVTKKDAAGKIIAEAGDVRTDSRFAPVVAGDIIGKHANDSVRLAGFIEGLRRGESPLDAWNAVTKNQLDYNPRTFGPLESKVLKKIFPFYSFMSRETAWLTHELMTNPTGRLGKLIQLARHSQPTNDFLPEHITQGLAVPLREGEDGTQNYLTGMGAMFESPIQLLGELGSGDMQGLSRSLLSMSSPLIKGPAEYGLGRSSFQGGPLGGRDISDLDPVAGRILTQLGIQKERPGGQAAPALGSPGLEFLLSNSPVSRILSSAKTALDDRKNVIERAANILTGMRITSVSLEQKQRGIRELTNAISKELGARAFTTYHISEEMLADAKESDPEKYTTLLRIKEMRKEWDKQQRIKRKERAKN